MLLRSKAEESGRPNSADCQAGTDTSSPRPGCSNQAMLPEEGQKTICLFIDTQLTALASGVKKNACLFVFQNGKVDTNLNVCVYYF